MQLDPHAVHIYTDGSCYGNPGGTAGCAALVEYPEHMVREEEQVVDFGCAESSNNRMELMACTRALVWIRQQLPRWSGVSRVQVVTDSRYVKDNIPRASEWKKNGWRNQFGEPRENVDLWKQFLSAYPKAGIVVHFEWTAGKKSPILKRIDTATKNAAKRGGTNVDRGYRPGTVSRSMVKGSAMRFPAQAQTLVIRPYRKNLMLKGENKIRFDVFEEDTHMYTDCCYAFAPADTRVWAAQAAPLQSPLQ